MKCSKEAFDKCPFNLMCDPGSEVGEDTDCAEFILKVEEEKHEQN